MSKKSSILSKIGSLIFIAFVIIALVGLHRIYKTHYFNDFYKAEENLNTTKFTRDSKVKYSDAYSYKLESDEYNDAMFYKTVNVEKDTSYRVTCMVKTENVILENELSRFWCTNMFIKHSICIKKCNRYKRLAEFRIYI